MDEQIIPIHDRAQSIGALTDMVGYVAAAAALLAAAAGQMPVRTPGSAMLAAAAFLAGGALILVSAREARRRIRGATDERERRVDWVSLFAGTVLLLDWYVGVRGGGKIVSPSLLAAAIAFLQPRLEALRRRRRVLRISDDGIALQITRVRRLAARWSELRRVEAHGAELRLLLTDGSVRRISLRRVINREEVTRAVLQAGGVRGLVAPAQEPALIAAS